jgi:hypothetical protein
MKKLLTLFIACSFALTAQAQKNLSEKELLGKWSMSAMTMEMGTVDFKKQAFTISEAYKEEFNNDEAKELGTVLLETLSYAKEYYLDFKSGNILAHNLDGDSEGEYKIVTKKGKHYLVDETDTDAEDVEVYIADKKLHFKMQDEEDGTDIVMIFEK